MKCSEVRTFLSGISSGSVSVPIQPPGLDFLSANGYVMALQKAEYDQAQADVSRLAQLNEELQKAQDEERSSAVTLDQEERKTHSIWFHFKGSDEKQAELKDVEEQQGVVSREVADVAERNSKLSELIRKKSMLDRAVDYGGVYLSLTALGVTTLNDLNIRNYRASGTEFPDFIAESKAISDELKVIVQGAVFHVSSLKAQLPDLEKSLEKEGGGR